MALNGWAADAQPIRASDLPPIAAPIARAGDASQMMLYLAVQLNARDMGMQPAQMRSNGLWMLRDTLLSMGLKPEALNRTASSTGSTESAAPAPQAADDWIALSTLNAADVKFNAAQQSVELVVPFTDLSWSSTELTTRTIREPIASASPGALINYDLYGYTTGSARSLSAATELRYFRANSVISNTMLTNVYQNSGNAAAAAGQDRFTNKRLDTTFSQSFQDDMLTLRIGDTLTGSLPWTRATRIGGIQIARNFLLQPSRVTTPIPALMGTSALPSDIALFINGIKQYQGNIPAGPFTLNTVPGITGAGNAQVVLTDALGRSTTLQYSLYSAPQLLAKGLSDWSAELGWVRRNFGTASFDYGSDPAASGTWSYGLTDRLTVQTHSEITPSLANASGGAVWQIGSLGVVSAATGASTYHGKTGAIAQVAHSWNREGFATNFQATRATENFRDVASLYDANRLQASGRAFVGYSHPALGSLNLGAVYLRNYNENAQRYVSVGWSRSFLRQGYVNLSVNRNLEDRKLSNVQLTLNWYLDAKTTLASSVTHQSGKNVATASATQQTPSEGGWGWRAEALSGDNSGAQARTDYRGRSFEANATVARFGNTTSAGLGANGSLIWMDGHAFASRRVTDSFALVSTSGIPNVPIKRENTVIGETNSAGVMLVPQLGAYRSNKISIDPTALPAQTKVPAVNQFIAPTDRAGVLVKFDIQRIRSATVVLHDAKGKPLPLGALTMLKKLDAKQDGGNVIEAPVSSLVGYDGSSYFESLGLNNRIEAHLPDGSRCQAQFAWPETGPNEVPTIGPIPCLKN